MLCSYPKFEDSYQLILIQVWSFVLRDNILILYTFAEDKSFVTFSMQHLRCEIKGKIRGGQNENTREKGLNSQYFKISKFDITELQGIQGRIELCCINNRNRQM